MSSRRWIELCATAIAAALLLASPAGAFPVVFNGPGGHGVSAATASSVDAAGFQIIEGESVFPAAVFNLQIPAPDVLRTDIKTHPSVSNPTTAQSRWSVTNGGERSLRDAWLVFFTPVTYKPAKVGIDLQPGGEWALVEVSAGKGRNYFYPAVFLGDLDPEDTITFLMNHIVGQKLKRHRSTLVLPKYSVGILQGVPLPEPSTLVLLAAGAVLIGTLRRRRD